MRQASTSATDALLAVGFHKPECRQFAEYFLALQQQTGCMVPPRKAFSPAAARSLLPYVSIMEIKEPRLALVRLVGTAIVSRTHIDNTGTNMLDLFPPEIHDLSWTHLRRLMDTPCGSTFLAEERYTGANVLIEVLSFPFADQSGAANHLISLSIEIDRQELMLRGDDAMHLGDFRNYRYLDIGSGT